GMYLAIDIYGYSEHELVGFLGDVTAMIAFFGPLLVVPASLIFITAPLMQSDAKYQLCAREDDINVGYIGYAFKNSYGKSVLCSTLLMLHVGIGALIACLPMMLNDYLAAQTGIAALKYINWLSAPLELLPIRTALRYMFAPMAIADDESISCSRAFFISDRLTKGYKTKLFGTFLPLYMLRVLADILLLFFGGLFVMPYIRAVHAEMYAFLKAAAQAEGFIPQSERKIFADDSGVAEYEFAPACRFSPRPPSRETRTRCWARTRRP
ncbi:MAG: hypothetical protein IKI47_04680, partial [Prevotella sp.]|nr:hypothetical protein [Prevotella sp.]